MSRIERLEKLLQEDAQDADLLYMLAQEHARNGDTRRAIEHFDRCLAIDPAYLYAYYHKGVAQCAAGDAGGASLTARAGLAAARTAGDAKAQGELADLLASFEEQAGDGR